MTVPYFVDKEAVLIEHECIIFLLKINVCVPETECS